MAARIRDSPPKPVLRWGRLEAAALRADETAFSPESLQLRAAFSLSTPDRMDFDKVVLAIVEVVHVAAGLLHEHTLDQLASCSTVALPPSRAWRSTVPGYARIRR